MWLYGSIRSADNKVEATKTATIRRSSLGFSGETVVGDLSFSFVIDRIWPIRPQEPPGSR